jgi:hypothetical protein
MTVGKTRLQKVLLVGVAILIDESATSTVKHTRTG